MSGDEIWQITILILLVFVSGFFSASETALMSLSKIKVRYMLDKKIKGSQIVFKLINQPEKLLGTILLGNNIVNIAASAIATSLAIFYFGSSGVGIATIMMTIIILIFAEITPKSIAAHNPEKTSLVVSRLIYLLSIIFGPVVKILTDITGWIIALFGGGQEKAKPFLTQEEFKTFVTVGLEQGIIEKREQEIIQNVFEFKESSAGNIMIPRTNMVAVNIYANYNEVFDLYEKYNYSRIPVYRESKDDIVGILYLKDLIFRRDNKENFNIETFMRKPFFSYEFTSSTKLFEQMKSKKVHMAIILGEFGGTAGIITMGDIVSEIVGDFEDGNEEKDRKIIKVKPNEYIVDGSTKLEKLNELINLEIESDEFDSINGFVMWKLKRVPKSGDVILHENIKMVIENVAKNRIKNVRIFT